MAGTGGTTGAEPAPPSGTETTGTDGTTGTGTTGEASTETTGETPTPPPTGGEANLTFSVSSRGVRGAGVRSRLASAEPKATACVTAARGRGVSVKEALTVRFGIKWNGSPQSVRVRGTEDKELSKCLRKALPGSRFPAPAAGKDGSATWTIQVQ